jgi:phosphinothricin acetyltransferase
MKGLVRELGRYFAGSAHSRLRQMALLGELDARRLADIGLVRLPRGGWGGVAYAPLPKPLEGAGMRSAEAERLLIKDAHPFDLSAIADIYAHHVLHGLASFEEAPPGKEEMRRRWEAIIAAKLPYLVAEREGCVVGYCYASPYRPRAAYRHTIEDSVYVAPGYAGQGIGGALLSALIERCEGSAWRQMVAVIGDSGNAGSIALHRARGFRLVGTLENVGFKFGRWVDTVLMQRELVGNALSGCTSPSLRAKRSNPEAAK